MAQPFLDLNLIVARVTAQVSALKRVAESMDIPSAADDLKAVAPAAYVLPLQDPAGPNALANAVSQQVTARFGVLLAVRNFRDPRGEAARSELTPLRSSVADALLNWQPGADYTPCEYGGGRLLQLTDQVLWWIDEYRTSFEVRAT